MESDREPNMQATEVSDFEFLSEDFDEAYSTDQGHRTMTRAY